MDFNIAYRHLCKISRLSYSTLMRWKEREKNGEEPVKQAGPKKVKPFEEDALKSEIMELRHGKKRSHGASELWNKYSDSISRRDFYKLLFEVRNELKKKIRDNYDILNWKIPNTVWSMDDTLFENINKNKLYLHNVQDLASKYKFKPLAGAFAKGTEVADNLRKLFNKYGPPLFFKRDNGSNLNDKNVEQILSEYFVIPLNSPPYCSIYNGSMEKANREIKDYIRDDFSEKDMPYFKYKAQIAAHDVNHIPRPVLKGKTSCQAYFEPADQIKFNKRKRKEIYLWIINLTVSILKKMNDFTKRTINKAWRIACENWLQRNGFVDIWKPKMCNPIYF